MAFEGFTGECENKNKPFFYSNFKNLEFNLEIDLNYSFRNIFIVVSEYNVVCDIIHLLHAGEGNMKMYPPKSI